MIYKLIYILQNIFYFVKYLFLPNSCIVCKQIIFSQDNFCIDCWRKLKFITTETCTKCLEPLSGTDVLLRLNHLPVCPVCFRVPPYIDHAKAVFVYTEDIRTLIIRFKHYDNPELAMFFARMMANAGEQLFVKSDFIIPIPIHANKMRIRKYNQAYLLAKYLTSFNSNIKMLPNVLYKSKRTKPQEGRTRRQRKHNIKNSFSVKNSHLIRDKNIVIVDDVHTTGSTLNECARILKKAGAKEVFTLTIAKVQQDSVMSVYDVGM